jgi:D-alanyl-D-alanine carboxypeptidase
MNKVHILTAILCFAVLSAIQRVAIAQIDPDSDKLDTFLTTLFENGKFMGSVAVLNEGELIFSQAYGVIDSGQTPATTETIYRIGSITKTFTSAMIMRLEEEGKISLNSTLDEFYPQIPNAEKITVEQLLRHRSGLVNFTSMPGYSDYFADNISKEELLEKFTEYGTGFEPGKKTQYSNTGYVLLGYIIEDLTGGSFQEALEICITAPLGLVNTYYGKEISSGNNEAQSFVKSDSWNISPQTNMFIPHGAGAVVSTPVETARFYRSLFEGELLSLSSTAAMTTTKDGMGMGIFEIPFYDNMAFGHTGGIDGFHTVAAHFPERDVTAAIFSNGLNYVLNDITIGVLSLIFGHDFDIPDFDEETDYVQLTADQIALYTGEYSSEEMPLTISLFEQGGRLMAQASGQGAFPLHAVNEKVMKFDPAGIEILFDGKEGQRFYGFTLKQMGQQYHFSRNQE